MSSLLTDIIKKFYKKKERKLDPDFLILKIYKNFYKLKNIFIKNIITAHF